MQNIIGNLSEKLLSNEINSISLPDFNIKTLYKNKIAVVLTCHQPYLKYVLNQINAIDNQTHQPFEKWIFFDDCSINEDLFNRNGWKTYSVNVHNPNILRNTAIELTKADWIVFADADDIMDKYYIKSGYNILKEADFSHEIAAVYADLQHSTGHIYVTPDKHDKNSLKISNYVSACSFWNIKALREVKGYRHESKIFDDWDLALRLAEKGWKFKKNTKCTINVQDHENGNRHLQIDKTIHFKNNRTYAIVTLLAGRDNCFNSWKKWLLNSELPERTSLYVLNNCNKKRFKNKLNLAVLDLNKSGRFENIHICNDFSEPYTSEDYWQAVHVAKLYNRILPKITEDFVVFLEDDVEPPLTGLTSLIEKYDIYGQVGAIAGIYASRTGGNRIVGAFGKQHGGLDYWHDIVTREDIKDKETLEVDFVAGGFTLYNNGLVQKSLPLIFDYYQDKWASGWDSDISRKIRGMNKKLILNCKVLCKHKI